VRTPRTASLALGTVLLISACSGGADEAVETTEAGDAGCADVDLSEAPAEPVTMRIGHGLAAEEPFWLMTAGDTSQHDGTWYEMQLSPFRGTAERLTAYQAGDLDAVVISPQAQITGTSRGALDLYTIATIMRDADPEAYSTSFVALEGSGIDSVEDLQGKRIAIIDEGSQLDFIARQGLREAGLDPDTDAQYVVFPFPAQEEALRGGQIDVAGLAEPFYTLAMSNGGVQEVYNAADLTDFAYDLLTVSFEKQFVEDNVEAVCAWAEDYAAAMEFYREDPQAAKQQLIGTEFVTLPPDIYLSTNDYARPEGGEVDTEGTAQMMDAMIEFGILQESDRIDTETLIRPGISLGH
jgi:ABC-type nitrate/sulfonate/bicarbonate transport system substrate-binding protein